MSTGAQDHARKTAPKRGAAPEAAAWQLVVHDSGEMAEMLMHTVGAKLQTLGRAAHTRHARNIDDAQAQLARHGIAGCSVVIVGSATPQDASASVALSGREPMLRFVERLKDERADIPVVVISATPDERLASFLGEYRATALVKMDSQFSGELARRVGEFHGERASASAPASGRLRFDLHLHGRQATWQISRSGDDPFFQSGELYIDDELMERVLFQSDDMERRVRADHLFGEPRNDAWLKALKMLSQDLSRLIFDGSVPNINCWETFLKHRERAGGIDRARIHVTVDSKTHPLLVEALRDRTAADPEYWMLRAPVLRRYQHAARRRPLFKDAERRADPINCLIVEADPRGGNVPEYRAVLEPLPHTKLEAESIVKVLRAAGMRVAPKHAAEPIAGGAPGCYEHLRLESVRGDLGDALSRKLKERPWHLLHFCGHVVAGDGLAPGLVLVPEPGGVIPVASLAAQLGGAQFVYLSSCRSASAKVVLQAVEQFVPAVLGFQWIIEDQAAAAFAKAFYEALFDRTGTGFRYLEYAFLLARRAVYERDPHRPGWVAPALVMQMD
jgi:hypothetical protein